jgi:NADPH:quinone reductase-like Zn-dependent oxidoreductase
MIGQLTGQFVPFNPAQLFLKNVSMLSATSTTLRQLEDCLAMVARGAVKPIVSLTLPLERAAEAHALVEAGKAVGRIVLRPNG